MSTTTNVVEKPRPRIEEERARRRRREDLSIGRQKNLAIDGDLDNRYEYRWINDDPGRVHNLTVRDDWDIVTADMIGSRSERDKGVGTGIERIVGKSDGKRGVLVRKLKEFYVSDDAKKQAMIDETDAALRRGEARSSEGLRETPDGKSYVPNGGISIQDGRRG